MVALTLKIPRADARLIICQFLALFRAVLMYFRPAFVRVALGTLGRDLPATAVIFSRALSCPCFALFGIVFVTSVQLIKCNAMLLACVAVKAK